MQTNKLTASALLICTCVIWALTYVRHLLSGNVAHTHGQHSLHYRGLTLLAGVCPGAAKAGTTTQDPPTMTTWGILGVCINNATSPTGLQYSTVTNFTIIATPRPS